MQLTINGTAVQVPSGSTLLEAAAAVNVEIPTLCHHALLKPVGSCRLCLVQVEGQSHWVPACHEPAADGMVVLTHTPEIEAARKLTLQLLAARASLPADLDPAHLEFWKWLRVYGVAFQPKPSLDCAQVSAANADPHPFLRVDLNACILCTRCVRACAEVQGRSVWHLAERGHALHIQAGSAGHMLEARCESCGLCADVCPTGALADRFALGEPTPEKLVTTTCSYCGVGCQFDLNVRDNRITRVTSNANAPVNGHALCVKGRYGHGYVHSADRLTTPQVRSYLLRGQPKPASLAERGEWVTVDWPTATALVANRLVGILRESGPAAVGLLSSAKCTNEENYLMQKFARQVLETHNIDHCARLCHSSTVAGLAMCYGSGAMSNSMDDLAAHAAGYFVIGSNTTEQHPVFGAMLRQAVRQRGAKLIVADPREIDLCEFATLHVRQRPGTDVALLNGLMHIILKRGWHDEAFIASRCENFDAFRETIERYPPSLAGEICSVPESQLDEAAALMAECHPLAVIWAMGITQHTTGVLNVLSLGNLQMLLGNMGIPGGGVNPLRGQNNVQGACDMGALPNVYCGYQPVAKAADKFAAAWQCLGENGERTPNCAREPGLTVTEMLDGAETGRVRALYILGEDPALSEPDGNHARRCLAAADFVVVQEILGSETAAFADVLLPGASFAEKNGTYTNTERRVQLVNQAIDPPGEAQADWAIIANVARSVLTLLKRTPVGPHAAWNYGNSWEILREAAALAPEYAGVTHERLVRGERLQWPVWNEQHAGTPKLHVGQFTRGRGKFHAVEHLPPQELPNHEYPLLLTTGRILAHWHGGELTRRVPGLMALSPQPLVEVHADDAARLGLRDGQPLRVVSRRGEMRAWAMVTHRVSPGVVFANFHFPGAGNANNLTHAALDPIAKIPEYKVCAVKIMPDGK